MARTAHIDTFAQDNLPPREQWPELIFDLPGLRYPGRLNCAAELLDRALERGWARRVALRSPEGELTYAQLLEQSNRIAGVLAGDMGLAPGNRVLLRGANSPWMAACWLAVIKAGGIAVATMPLLRAKELTEIILKAKVTHALCDRHLDAELKAALPACSMLKPVVYWHDDAPDSLAALAARKPGTFTNADTAAEDVALIAFTSGTTGKPKGTVHFHRDVIAMCDCFPRSCLMPAADDIFCGTPPLAFTFGLGGMLCFPMRFGASVVLVEKPTPNLLLETIAKHKATICFTAPTFYRQMAQLAPGRDLRSLKKCVSAGEALPDATRQMFKQATGTEMIHIFISHTPERVRRGATGYALPGYRAAVLDDEGRPCAAGAIGRLAVKGPTGCRYLADERQRDYVQGGWNITGPEVEGALLAHEAVSECGVVGVPDEDRGQVVKAYVVLKAGYAKSDALGKSLQDHVKGAIAPYKYPRRVE